MAFGLAPLSQSFKADMRMIGGIVTGSSGEYLALPISSTVLQGLSGLTTNEWSRFYLSDSFGAASASVIQALNYLSASMDATSGDVTGPASSTDNAVVRFNGATGKSIQNSTLVKFTDAGAFTGGANGDSYSLAANGAISGGLGITAATTVSGAGAVSGKSLTTEESTISVAGVVSGAGAGTFGTLTTEEATISIAGVVSGAGALQGQSVSVANAVVITTAGAVEAATSVVATTTVSGAGAVSGQNLVTEESTITAAGVVSGAGAGQFGTLVTEEAAISVAGVVSGAGAVQGQKLTIANSDVVTTAGAVAAVTTVSGASSLAGAKLTINGTDVATQAGALVAPTTVSGAGNVAGASITSEEATISVAGVISGAGALQGGALFIGNGAGQVTADGAAIFGGTVQAAAVSAGAIKSVIGGSITGSVGAGIVASNTGSVNNANQKVAFSISSSDISTAANSALIPRMVMQGTNEAGALASYMITITGGLLQTIELAYGTALPV